jgi:hypothetical protein
VSDIHGVSDYWVAKLATDGTIQWQKALGGTKDDYANSIQQTKDGEYVVAGGSNSSDGDVSGGHGSFDYWVVKLAADGTIQWRKAIGGTGYDDARSIQQTRDGGYVVAGYSSSSDGDVSGGHGVYDYWVVKLAADGTIPWRKALGGAGIDLAYSIQQTKDGGYVVAGTSLSSDGDVSDSHGNSDCWVVKLAPDGAIQWQKALGGTGSDSAHSIQQTKDGGYVVAGYLDSSDGDAGGAWIVKLTPEGVMSDR